MSESGYTCTTGARLHERKPGFVVQVFPDRAVVPDPA
ncbi:hypothetical protein HDC95_001363 [Microbacterium sp. AK031]|nr:hypothetical protein [Microbacterium sp. AK031]